MARDLLRRPPLRASELSADFVSMHPGEARAIRCPGCQRWQKPRDGGLRRHAVDADSAEICPESGRRVFFDLTPAEWRIRYEIAAREAALRRGSHPRRSGRPPVPPPVFRLATAP